MSIKDTIKNNKGFTLLEVIITGVGVTLASAIIYAGCLGINALDKYIDSPEVVRANVIGGPEDELFIERDGMRFYSQIDGKPVNYD